MAPDDQAAVPGDGHHDVRVMWVQQLGHTCLRLQRGPVGPAGEVQRTQGSPIAVGLPLRMPMHEGSIYSGAAFFGMQRRLCCQLPG